MGCCILISRSMKVQNHQGILDHEKLVCDAIICQCISLRTLVQISIESRQESGDNDISDQITDSIIKNLREIISLARVCSSLNDLVLNEYLGALNVLRKSVPTGASNIYFLSKQAQILLEDKTDDNFAPVVLRTSEINRILHHSGRNLKVSTRMCGKAIVIQKPAMGTEVKETRLKRLFVVRKDILCTPSNGSTHKSQCSEHSGDFGFFDPSEDADHQNEFRKKGL